MARHFVRLKLRITANSVSGGDVWSLVGQVLIWLSAVAFGVGAGALLAFAIEYLPKPEVVAILAGAILQVGWVVVPLLASTLDATLDPRDFELLPLGSGELGRGLLVAGVVGPGGLLTVLVAGIGLGLGLWPGPLGVVVTPVLLVLVTFLCVVSGRLVTAVVSEGLARARAGVIAGTMVGLMGAAVVGTVVVAPTLAGAGRQAGLPAALEWLAVLPGGAVGAAFHAVDVGDVGRAVGFTTWALISGMVLTWTYGWWLDRMRARSVTAAPGRVRGDGTTLGSGLERFIRSAPVRVAAAKELRYLRRDPRLRAQLLGGVVVLVVFLSVSVSFSVFDTPYAPFLAVLGTWALIATVVPNQFGVDAGSFWGYVVSPTNVSAALLGKNLVWAMLAVPTTIAVAGVGAVLSGTAAYVAAALLAAAAVFLIWMAVGNLTSIYGAFPLPDNQLFGSGPNTGRAVVVSLIGLAVSGALTGPVVLATGFATYLGGPGPATVAAMGGVVYAGVLFSVALNCARGLVIERRFELLRVLDKR